MVLHDGAGHAADPQAVKEVEQAGLATVKSDRAEFTQQGQEMLGRVLDAIRGAAR